MRWEWLASLSPLLSPGFIIFQAQLCLSEIPRDPDQEAVSAELNPGYLYIFFTPRIQLDLIHPKYM